MRVQAKVVVPPIMMTTPVMERRSPRTNNRPSATWGQGAAGTYAKPGDVVGLHPDRNMKLCVSLDDVFHLALKSVWVTVHPICAVWVPEQDLEIFGLEECLNMRKERMACKNVFQNALCQSVLCQSKSIL
jgi:hypothetical protein